MENKNVFLDANIVIDFFQASSTGNALAASLVNFLLLSKRKIIVSPVTFAISCYFLKKSYSNLKVAKKIAQKVFSHFTFSEHLQSDVTKSLKSYFIDLEDALQYHSALNAGVDVIITENYHDYFPSKVKVMYPFEFMCLYNT